MIRVAEHVSRTDTGRQRATNEDSHLERTPLFVVADGMGGAQAGEVASQLAVAHFAQGMPDADGDEGARERLLAAAREANAEIHALSEADARRAGMGTTLTAAYVGVSEVFIVHVGDSRAYRWRDGVLERITEDHSLVEELLRQGRLTEEEAEEHPQRSIITRALGPEPDVEIDSVAVGAAPGDVFLLCSDGLTSMVGEAAIADVLAGARDLATAADELIAHALAAGGRDNVTVVLFRIEDPGAAADGNATQELRTVPDPPTEDLAAAAESLAVAAPPAEPARPRSRSHTGVRTVRTPRPPRGRPQAPRRRRRRLWIGGAVVAVLAIVVVAGVLAAQAVYFIGTDSSGQVTVYNGLPYTLPGGVRLYTQFYVSGVTVAELSKLEQGRLFDNELRSQAGATRLVSQLELGRIAGQ